MNNCNERLGRQPQGGERETIGMRVEDWHCHALPEDGLSDQQRQEVIDYAASFEECHHSRNELTRLLDRDLVAAAYGAMAEYARGQM